MESFCGHLARFIGPTGGLASRPDEASDMPAKLCHKANVKTLKGSKKIFIQHDRVHQQLSCSDSSSYLKSTIDAFLSLLLVDVQAFVDCSRPLRQATTTIILTLKNIVLFKYQQ